MRKILRWKISIFTICLTAIVRLSVFAQAPAPEREKPRLKDFGYSLKRLKWDANKNTAVETRSRKRTNPNDDYVVRVETTLVVTDVLVVNKEWRPVLGLTRDDFIVTEDGQSQEVGAFSLGDDAKIPRTIVERSQGLWDIKPEVKARLDEEFKKMSPEALKGQTDLDLSMQLALAGVAKITGGWHDFLEDPSQADTIYSLIFSDINRRYVIGYYPTNKDRDGKRRKITVAVRDHPEYVVWGRKSYYAPEPE